MGYVKVYLQFILVLIALCVGSSSPIPDSAGLVEMPPGLAYGGIPYGSVTGLVADYYNSPRSISNNVYADSHYQPRQPTKPVYYN